MAEEKHIPKGGPLSLSGGWRSSTHSVLTALGLYWGMSIFWGLSCHHFSVFY